MGKNEKLFYRIMIILLFVTAFIGSIAIYAEMRNALAVANVFLPFMGILFLAMSIFILMSFLSCILVYKNDKSGKILSLFAELGIKVMYPIMMIFAGFYKDGKDSVRGFFIDLNNKLVSNTGIKVSPDKVLILLPHCLQNNNCTYKVAGNISNCRRCGVCKLGDLAEMADEFSVNLYVATGGTAARKVIKEQKPEVIISVACERDLASGIIDVKGIPVIGILNDRPNGPCLNTDIQLERVREELLKICQRNN